MWCFGYLSSICNKTFNFQSSYLHSKLKDRLKELFQLSFIKKNSQHRYKYLVLGRDRSYFVKKKKTTHRFYQRVLWNWYHQHARVFVMFAGRVLQQTVGIWVKTVLLFSPTCSFLQMRETSHRGFSRKTKRS